MITQYTFTLKALPGHPLFADSAYRLYAHLLEKLPGEYAAWLHADGSRAVSQFLRYEKARDVCLWTVNILQDTVAEMLAPLLDGLEAVSVENQTFPVLEKCVRKITADMLLHEAREETGNRITLRFHTATSFKQNGRYVIFPQERLILQSLTQRWNEVFPAYVLEDEDAFQALLSGIHIVDYQLRTSRFPLKGVRIPGFVGTCVLEARLALPLMEIFHALMAFAPYSGIGIKTGLGMGGVERQNGSGK